MRAETHNRAVICIVAEAKLKACWWKLWHCWLFALRAILTSLLSLSHLEKGGVKTQWPLAAQRHSWSSVRPDWYPSVVRNWLHYVAGAAPLSHVRARQKCGLPSLSGAHAPLHTLLINGWVVCPCALIQCRGCNTSAIDTGQVSWGRLLIPSPLTLRTHLRARKNPPEALDEEPLFFCCQAGHVMSNKYPVHSW